MVINGIRYTSYTGLINWIEMMMENYEPIKYNLC